MKNLLKIFNRDNRRIKTQILFVNLLILIIIVSIVQLLTLLNLSLVLPFFEQSSKQIYQKISENAIKSNLYQYQTIILDILRISISNIYYFCIDGDQLITLHQLYIQTYNMVKQYENLSLINELNMNYSGMEPIPEILKTKDGYGGFDTSNCFLCYSNLTELSTPLSRSEQLGLKIEEYLQAFGQIIYQGSLTKQSFDYGYTLDDEIFYVYPCLNRKQKVFSYVPQTRNWYIDALEQYNKSNFIDYQYGITKPYLLYTEQVLGLSMYLPMINEKKQFIGALSTNIYSQEFSKFIHDSKLIRMALLIDEEGILIFHNYPHVSFEDLPLLVTKESITGFTQEDWNYIKTNNGSLTNSTYFNLHVLCIYNSYFKQDLLVGVNYLRKYNLYLVILYDTKEFNEFQSIQASSISDYFSSVRWYFIQANFYLLIGIILFVVGSIVIITKPINLIIHSLRARMDSNHCFLEKLNWIDQIIHAESIYNLYFSYHFLLAKLQGQTKKSEICLQIQELNYPRITFYFNLITKITQNQGFGKLSDKKKYSSIFHSEILEKQYKTNQNRQKEKQILNIALYQIFRHNKLQIFP